MEVDSVLKIPKGYEKDFLNGTYEVVDVLTRNTKTGKFTKHAGIKVKETKKISNGILNKLDAKSIVLGAGAVLVVFGVGKIIKVAIKKQKEKNIVEIPKCIIDFNEEFKKYLNDAQNSIINNERITNLINLLDEIEQLEKEDINVDFTNEELRNLILCIYDFTVDLAEKNKISTNKLKKPISNSKDNIVYLKDYFLIQKDIVDKKNIIHKVE